VRRGALAAQLGACAIGLLVASRASAQTAASLVSVEAYGNLQAAGVVATVSGDTNRNASASLEWRVAGGSFALAHELVRIDATHLVGSLFELQPTTSYEARVVLSDPDGTVGAPSAVAPFVTRPETLPDPTLRTLYVSPTGDDGNTGTDPAHSLRTLQAAADRAQAGDLILVGPGVYRESVTVDASGTFAQPIVFRGNGSGVILDGADAAIASGVSWTPLGGGVFSRVLGFPTGHVTSGEGRLFRYGTLPELQGLAAGPPGGFFFDGTTLYVKFPDGSSPSAHSMHVARLEDGFLLDGVSNVRIEGFEMRHFGSGDYGKGVYLRFASDCAVRSCRIHEVGSAGVWIKGGSRHRIEDNEIWDTSIFGWPWDLTKGSSAENNGVTFTDDVGRGNVVRRNMIHGSFNGMGPCGSAVPPAGLTNETDIYDNALYQHTDDALEPEGYCANVRIWGNRMQDVHMAVAAAPAAPGPLWVLRNIGFRIGNTRTSQIDGYMASALKINSGYATPIGPLLLYHNSFLTDAPSTEGIALLNPGSSTFIRARNNIIAGTRYSLYKVNPVSWDGNGDDLYSTDASRLVYWLGTRYDTLAAFRSAQGQELQGLSAPPQLTDPAGGNFAPLPASPLVDKGLRIPGINDGWRGTAPDVGALEVGTPPSVSILDAAITEGNAGSADLVFTVSLSEPDPRLVTVSYATADGSASAPGDYTGVSGMLGFPPGVTSRTIAVPVHGDLVAESDENFLVNLSSPTNAVIARGQATGTIVDDDAPPADLSVSKTDGRVTAAPGDAIAYTVTISNAGPNPVTGVTVSDTVPVSLLSPTWTCVPAGGASCGTPSGSGSISESVNLPVGGTVAYALSGTVSASPASLSNTATASLPAGFRDPDPADNSATDTDVLLCGSTTALVPDGRVTSTALAPGATRWLLLGTHTAYSYSLEAQNRLGTSAPGTLTLFRGVDGCTGSSTATSRNTSSIDPAAPTTAVRLAFTSSGADPGYRLRLTNSTASSIDYDLSLAETTFFSPAWSTNGTYNTYYSFQNTTGSTITATLTLTKTDGSSAGSSNLTIPAGATASTNTAALVTPRNATGTARLTHDGPPGALLAESAIANFATSPAYIQPVKFKTVRETR
jgi:uncharacterized repeat protein (TIGR01451 family)